MNKKYSLVFTLAGITFIIMGMQCNKEMPVAIVPIYKYTAKLDLAPFKKVYSINDTIWIQYKTTDKTLFDKLSGNNISTDTTYLQVFFTLIKQYPVDRDIQTYASVVVENGLNVNFGPLTSTRNDLTFNTSCNNDPYFFRVGFVLLKAGVYSLMPGALVSPCPDKKINLPSDFTYTYDLPDCNYDVWKSIATQSANGQDSYIGFGIEAKQIFAIRVE